ncbi:MAG: hypothetical protein ABI416_10615 [Ginsengibacter sp.]
MIEIIVLIFLTKEVGKIAHEKGLKPVTWKIYTILGWILSEIIGVFIGIMIFGQDNLVSIILVGLLFAVTSYFIIKAQLRKFPDLLDDDIDNIGNN